MNTIPTDPVYWAVVVAVLAIAAIWVAFFNES